MHLLSSFIVQNLKRILRTDSELQGCAILGLKMTHLPGTNIFPKQDFFGKYH